MVNRLLLSSLLLGALGGVAVADDQPADPAAPPAGDPAGGMAPAAGTGEAAATARWPKGVIDRPLTLPSALLMVGADFYVAKISDTAETLDAAIGYGVTDDLEINTITPTYNILLNPSGTAKGPLDAGIGYKLLRGAAGGKLEVIARAVIGYDVGLEYVRPLRLGVQVQYNATPKLAILSHDIGLGNAGISIGLDAPDLGTGIDVPKPVFLTLPVGVAYQATPELWIEADTAIASAIKISNSNNVFISDATPLYFTGIYNTMEGHLDLLGYVGFGDLQNAGDSYAFGIGFRYYAGKT